MLRDRFVELVEEVLDSLPEQFREHIQNLAVIVEDRPPGSSIRRKLGGRGKLILGLYQGVPATRKSVFDLPHGPDRIVLYQKNIEAVCRTEAEIRHEVRQTVLHEIGHYFGMTEEQLKDV